MYGLALDASADALADAGRDGEDVDLVLAATLTPDRVSPALAAELSARQGTRKVGAVDLNAACTGFMYALDYAHVAVESGRYRCVVVCGADAVFRITDMTDRSTGPLFGDAAGAVVVTADEDCGHGRCRPVSRLGSDRNLGHILHILHIEHADRLVRMDGPAVFEAALEAMAEGCRDVCLQRGLAVEDVDLFVTHQANARIISALVRELDVPMDRVVVTVDEVGNTSSSSIPVALTRAQRDGRLVPGATVALTAFGAGLTWGAAIVDWKGCVHAVGADTPGSPA
ncbi:beta-ketoacyl-ACP synthase 3 [Streptomyces sp. P1-3]|uniref:beta-ketoacyl-ACP synthase 3 n=1 Tax=Streptomyces sp. P1-3 TaxID=3421658 RepID=UPI003D36CD62